jgi:O-succinylbenzoate synthase
MKIEEVEVFQVKLPVKDPFKTSFGVMCEQVSVVMKIRSEGLTAWGESSPFWAPIYSSESTGSVCLVLKDFLLPAILGKNLNKPEELLQMIAFVRGNQFAKSAIEIAFWNLMAEAEQKPLHVLLGGIQEKVTVGAPIGIQETPQILLQEIERFLQKGYHRIKLKIMHGWDMDILREVRKAFPKIKLTVDPNAAYSIKDTIR